MMKTFLTQNELFNRMLGSVFDNITVPHKFLQSRPMFRAYCVYWFKCSDEENTFMSGYIHDLCVCDAFMLH